jgi:hypothetical protein
LRRLLGVLLLSTLGVCAAVAGELAPFREGTRLGVRVKNLSLPASFRKDLRSGLTNRLLLRVELLAADAKVVQTRTVQLAVKYDLWDENFRLTLDAGQGSMTESVLATEQQVLAFINDVPLPALFDTARLQRGQDHQLRGDALLNPIEQERMANIRKWVAENSTQTPGSGATTSAPVGAATSGDLFNRIFDRYASGVGDTTAAWHDSLQSRAFRPESLPHEGQ